MTGFIDKDSIYNYNIIICQDIEFYSIILMMFNVNCVSIFLL